LARPTTDNGSSTGKIVTRAFAPGMKMDAEICTKCHRAISTAEQVVVLDGRVVCSRCALQHRPVEVQKRYIPPPTEAVIRRDPWATPKRRRQRRSRRTGRFFREIYTLTAILAIAGAITFMFRLQIKTFIRQHTPPMMVVPRSIEPKCIDVGSYQISIASFGWSKPKTASANRLGVVVQIMNRSKSTPIHSTISGSEQAQAELWFINPVRANNFWQRLWQWITGRKASWTSTGWINASPNLKRLPSSVRMAKLTIAPGHSTDSHLHFIFHSTQACRWAKLRLSGQNMGRAGELVFKLPQPTYPVK